jgi:dUTPase
MKIKYYLKNVDGLIVPSRANETDAGYDISAVGNPKVVGTETTPGSGYYAHVEYVEYETNLFFVPDPKFGELPNTPDKFVDVRKMIYVGENFHTDVRPRSSITSKTNFVLANSIGLIDRGYMNQVLVRFKYIFQPEDLLFVMTKDSLPTDESAVVSRRIVGTLRADKMYKKGDKIAQMLPIQTHDIEFNIVDTLPGVDRGGGFGSSDRK